MRTYERYWWWVKKKKQMALVLFMIVTLMLQLQMKGCVGCLETERMGLLQLKNGFKVEEESMLKSWSHDDPSSDCCHWKRVKCSDATTGGHVVHLSLDELIPASYELENQSPNLSLFHSFPRLQNLKLSFNKFSDLFDPINVLTGMPMLQELDLSNNGFTDFDKLGVMLPSSLHVLNLANNQLPSTPKGYLKICALMNFRELDLSSNALTNTPYCLANLSRLRTLDLSENKISGDLSSFVPGLPSTLEYLSLFDNDFNGSFWFSSLANHTRLTVFKLSTKLGTIQTQAESSWLPPFQLKILKLKKFNLGSTIPSFLAHQHDLRSGLIYGSLPEDIGIVFPHLSVLKLSNNQLQGKRHIHPGRASQSDLSERPTEVAPSQSDQAERLAQVTPSQSDQPERPAQVTRVLTGRDTKKRVGSDLLERLC
uniref:Leucine-rich repeat-containing N-terminal plant-type domain-containing protein n=1 Tax=Brassica oleracea var. oleracea TaxID=109376 RepID=A0A0D3BIA5_BRAOL